MMAEKHLEPLEHRNSSAYAEAYSCFYTQMLFAGVQVFGADFDQSIPVDVSFVPMMHPTKVRKQRGKISGDERNAAVARVQELATRSERGELSGKELKRLLAEL